MYDLSQTCSQCKRKVGLNPRSIYLAVSTIFSFYAFICTNPECGVWELKPADSTVISVLMSAGVSPQLFAPSERVGGERLNYDDLLDFVLRLSVTDDIVAAASGQ